MLKKIILSVTIITAVFAGEAELKKAWSAAAAVGKKGNWAEASRLYAQAFEANGDAEIPAEFFYDYGDALTGAGKYRPAIDEFERALGYATLKRPDLAAYNIACSYSRLGDFGASTEALKWAVYLGYKNMAHLEKDADLAGLRSQANWPSLLANLKSKNVDGGNMNSTFKENITQFHKALKSKNEKAISEWVLADAGENYNRTKLLGILNQAKNLSFRTPIAIKGGRGLAQAQCQGSECVINYYEKPLGPTGGPTHTYTFTLVNFGKEHYRLLRYECAGGCEP